MSFDGWCSAIQSGCITVTGDVDSSPFRRKEIPMTLPRMTRRVFLEQAALGIATLPAALQAAVDNTEPMKVTQVDAVTFRKGIRVGGGSGGSEDAEFCWVRLHTDKGIIGTGETYPYHQGEIGALRDYARQI